MVPCELPDQRLPKASWSGLRLQRRQAPNDEESCGEPLIYAALDPEMKTKTFCGRRNWPFLRRSPKRVLILAGTSFDPAIENDRGKTTIERFATAHPCSVRLRGWPNGRQRLFLMCLFSFLNPFPAVPSEIQSEGKAERAPTFRPAMVWAPLK